MRFTSSRKPDTGFTLIELIVTLVVAGVLLAIALPSMRTFLQDSRIVSQSNELVAALSLARSEAIKRYATVSLCASDDGSDCTNSNWEDGWIVFTDSGVPGTVDGGDTILKAQQGLDGRLTLTKTGVNFLSYQASGMLVAACEGCIEDSDSIGGSSRIARILLAVLGINDAMADGSSGGGGSGKGGFQSGCSNQNNSNNINSAKCKGGSGKGGSGGGGSGGSGGGGGGVAAAATFTLCDASRTGETGRSVEVGLTGRVRTEKITCD